jgi:hypothetical protein
MSDYSSTRITPMPAIHRLRKVAVGLLMSLPQALRRQCPAPFQSLSL